VSCFFQRLWALALVLALTACGGGGGGGNAAASNSISLDRSSLQFVLGTGDRDVSQFEVAVAFRGAGVVVATLPGQVLPSWLSVNAGTPTGNAVRVTVSAADAPNLQPGSYSTTLRFATGNADQTGVVTQDLAVNLKVAPRLAPGALAVETVTGGAPPAQTVTIDTPNPWTARTDQPWLTLNRSQGTGAATVAVSVAPAQLSVGEVTGSVTVEDSVTGVTHVLPVRVAVDARRLLVRKPTVTLSAYANPTTLSGSVAVADTGNAVTRWSASADQPWLSLSRSTGQTPDTLGVTANPGSLPDGLHHARITISPSNEPAVANSVVVRVALRVDRTLAVQPLVALAMNELSCPGPRLADPLRNRIYVVCGSALKVRDIDSAAEVASIDLPGSTLASLAASSDGSSLFGVDTALGRIVRINLDTLAAGSPITGVRVRLGTALAWADVQGQPVLATGELEFFNADTGARLLDAASLYDSTCCGLRLAARRDGQALYALNSTQGNHDLLRFSLAWRSGSLQVKLAQRLVEPGRGSALALDDTDATLVTAVGAISLPSGANAGALLRHPDTLALRAALPIVGGVGADSIAGFEGARLWLVYSGAVAGFDANQAQTGSYTFGDSLGPSLLSADGRRLVVLASQAANGYVRFVDRP
jgi:hypothetical protein